VMPMGLGEVRVSLARIDRTPPKARAASTDRPALQPRAAMGGAIEALLTPVQKGPGR
jgi:hypothetical protein